ncbi:MAG: PadR family transcriptional regulator [Hungatella sp.]|nr:PadR family transcriptional regulator [Hungatella sp.]
MLSKPATMLLGLIYEKPLNAYEIIKLLNYMNVKWWFNIADSTVYSTLKSLEKKEFILGTTEKVGNMPDRTVYSLSDKGKDEFIATLRASVLQFNYDTNIFSIAAFFLNTFTPEEQQELLQERLTILQKYHTGIEKQVNPLWENEVSTVHVANVKRMIDLVDAEIIGTKRLLAIYSDKQI